MYLIVFLWGIGIVLFQKKVLPIRHNHGVYLRTDLFNRVILFLGMFPFFLLASLRLNVGTDYVVYSNKQIPEVLSGNPKGVEPLYRAIIHVGNYINTSSYQWIFVITHLIIIVFFGKAIYRRSNSYIWSIYVFIASGLFNYSMNIMRQAIAISIFLYALDFLLEGKYKTYLVLVLVATLFHYTAILYVLFLLIKKIKLSEKWSFMFLGVIFIFRDLIRILLYQITSYIGKYNQYFGSHLDTKQLGTVFLILNLIILVLFYRLIQYYSLDDSKKNQVITRVYFTAQYLSTLIVVLSTVLPNYERLMYMFMSVQVLSVPFFIKKINNNYLRIVVSIFIVLVYFLCFYRLFILGNIGETFPYQSIL